MELNHMQTIKIKNMAPIIIEKKNINKNKKKNKKKINLKI